MKLTKNKISKIIKTKNQSYKKFNKKRNLSPFSVKNKYKNNNLNKKSVKLRKYKKTNSNKNKKKKRVKKKKGGGPEVGDLSDYPQEQEYSDEYETPDLPAQMDFYETQEESNERARDHREREINDKDDLLGIINNYTNLNTQNQRNDLNKYLDDIKRYTYVLSIEDKEIIRAAQQRLQNSQIEADQNSRQKKAKKAAKEVDQQQKAEQRKLERQAQRQQAEQRKLAREQAEREKAEIQRQKEEQNKQNEKKQKYKDKKKNKKKNKE
jgi:hypothetical protein